MRIDRQSRSERVKALQKLLGFEKKSGAFVVELNRIATELGLPPSWSPARLSKMRTAVQDLSLEDAAVFAALDPKERGWEWIAFGEALPRIAKRRPGAGAPHAGLRSPGRVTPKTKESESG